MAPAAMAQKVGTYNGTQANGQSYSLSIATDSSNGEFQITGGGIGVDSAVCKPNVPANVEGYGYGANQDFTGKTVTYIAAFPTLWVNQSLHFAGNTVSGTITTYEAVFANVAMGRPKRTVFCTVPKQTFTATLAAPAAGVAIDHWTYMR